MNLISCGGHSGSRVLTSILISPVLIIEFFFVLLFLHNVINSYCDVIRPPYAKFSSSWTFEEWLDVKEGILNFYKEALRTASRDTVKDQLKHLPDDYNQVIWDVLELRRNDLRIILLSEVESQEPCYLKNFDWEVNLSLANDKLAAMYDPHLNLKLELSNDTNGNGSKHLNIEVERDYLVRLISSLEEAAKVIANFDVVDVNFCKN
ncbi:hypothetical protein HELRODRAFT_166204 [Helobdella robusta]|uniref:COMM domain-containing protein n=1 Tax=Helobdella robusta TaxID=6412 RepID=T1EXW6_HELRO|nr:hypothetical protein HELRODRAFT_166204 [Helobdella robusta]ESN90530.1 hypothetical protein HELRODRAFT_166204 [Helobdella robusta]